MSLASHRGAYQDQVNRPAANWCSPRSPTPAATV